MRKSIVSAATLSAVALGTALSLTASAAATTVVSPSDPSWSRMDTAGTGSVSFGSDFGAPAGFGNYALELSTPSNSDKAQYFTGQDAGVSLASIADDISYYTYRSAGQDSQLPSLNIAVDTNGPAVGGFTTLVFEPVYNTEQGTVETGAWQQWNASGPATWWSTHDITGVCAANCFVSLDSIVANNPGATVLGYGVNQGSGNPGLVAAADGLTIAGKTFDFEVTKNDCKGDGWETNFAAGTYKNQGECVSHFAAGK
jgi:hypothetical protein